MTSEKKIQYACAVVLIATSIIIALLSVWFFYDIAAGVLIYIAQAFLLAGSIFGLDYYVSLAVQKFNKIKQ